MLRAVLDTNLVVAAHKSIDQQSPNREIIDRWLCGEFTWLISEDIAAEYAEKLLQRGVAPSTVEAFVTELFLLAETVEIRFSISDTIRWIPTTPFFCCVH